MKGFVFLTGFFLLVSCAALPVIQPSGDHKTTCPSPFPDEKTRLIHAIEAGVAGETRAVMIGVTVVDPVSQEISCAIISPEGLSLFEARFGPDGMKVIRALAPFDAQDFASRMMEDMKLIFIAPRGEPRQKGLLASGDAVCRWHKDSGGWIDILQSADGRVRILLYSDSGGLRRAVALTQAAGHPYAAVDLEARGMIEYKLAMKLIEVETIKDRSPLED